MGLAGIKKFTGGHGACAFRMCYYKNRKKKCNEGDEDGAQPQLWKLGRKSTFLSHSADCPVVLKVKSRQLISHPGFRNQVVCDGKASLVNLTTRLQEPDGLPVTGMKSSRIYAARRAVEAQHHLVYSEKFASLPRYLYDICAQNPSSWFDVKCNEHTGEFMAAFLAFGPAFELLRHVGRNVSGADFGHSTSKVLLHFFILLRISILQFLLL